MDRIAEQWLQEAGQPIPTGAGLEISPLHALDAEELAAKFMQGQINFNDLTG